LGLAFLVAGDVLGGPGGELFEALLSARIVHGGG
jgi:hypothetical protein